MSTSSCENCVTFSFSTYGPFTSLLPACLLLKYHFIGKKCLNLVVLRLCSPSVFRFLSYKKGTVDELHLVYLPGIENKQMK